jgi:malonate transporter
MINYLANDSRHKGDKNLNLTQSLLVIFCIIFLGMACEKRKIFNSTQIEGFEIFLFKVLMPCYLFTATLHYDFKSLLDINYIYSYLLSFAAIALIIVLLYANRKSSSEICIKILTAGYVNSAMYSLPVITFLLGDPKAAILGNLLQVIVIQTGFVTLLSLLKHKEKSILHRLFSSFTTPLVLMPIIGLLCNYWEFNPHPILLAAIKNMGNGASGIALFAFGLSCVIAAIYFGTKEKAIKP